MAVDWLPTLVNTRQLTSAYANGAELLRQVATFLAKDARPLLTELRAQCQVWWHDPSLVAALTQIERCYALWLKDAATHVALHGAAHDLPLAYPAAWNDSARVLTLQDIQALKAFLSTAAADPQSAVWTSSLLREAQLHVIDAHNAALVQAAHTAWQPIMAALLLEIPRHPLEAYLAVLDMQYRLGDLATFLETYTAFCRTHPNASSAIFPWRDELRTPQKPTWLPLRQQFIRLLKQLITVRQLQHRAAEPDLALLQQILDELQSLTAESVPPGDEQSRPAMPSRGLPNPGAHLPTPNPFGFGLPPLAQLASIREQLRQIHMALTQVDELGQRRAAVVGLWRAFAERHTFDLINASATLATLPAATEALGVLTDTLRGEIAYYAGRYEDAQRIFAHSLTQAQALLQLPDLVPEQARNARTFIGLVLQWRGNALFYLADYAAASACYAELADYLAADDPEAALLHALNCGNLAFLRNNLTDHRGYVTYDKKEQALLKSDGDPDSFLRLKYDKHRAALDEAAAHYATARQRVQALPDPFARRNYAALITANQANVWWMQANLQQEAAFFSPSLAQSLSDLGEGKDLYTQALTALQQVCRDVRSGPYPDTALISATLANISELHLLLDAPQQSVAVALECLAVLGISAEADVATMQQQFTARGMVFPETGWRVWLTLARAYEKQNQVEQAGRAYQQALQLVEVLRGQIRAADWQTSAAQDKFQVFECALHFHYATGRDTGTMFNLAEQLRAQTFLELLEHARLNLDAALKPELRQQRDGLAAEFASRNNAIRAQAACGDSPELETLLAAQRDLITRWHAMQNQIDHDLAAESAELNPQPLTWATVQAWLINERPDTVLLAFVVGSEWSYLLVGDAGSLDVYELPGRAAIEYAVSRLLWFAQKGIMRWEEFFGANRHAVDVLFGPALQAGLIERLRGKSIVILPDGVLYYLPFEMLLLQTPTVADGTPIDPKTHRAGSAKRPFEACADLMPFYMLNLGTVSLAQSATIWHTLQIRPPGTPDALALGIYNIHYKTGVPLGAGHQRAQELLISYNDLAQTRAVASILKAMERADTTLLALSAWNDDQTPWPSERQSNEANFKRLLAQHAIRYVLFAGHGVFNDKYPHLSGLVFNLAAPDGSAPNGDAPQDGFFGLNDVFNIHMPHTELVFLAACQGGLGLISRGEGVNALTRALMYRGSPSVIASLWSVDVQATMELVKAFFRLLNAEPEADKAVLLAAAKRSVAASSTNPQFIHPYCWAPFVLLGKR